MLLNITTATTTTTTITTKLTGCWVARVYNVKRLEHLFGKKGNNSVNLIDSCIKLMVTTTTPPTTTPFTLI